MKPLLLIDVDGPLNPYAAKPERRPDGYETHRARPSGWPGARPLRLWLNPAHGAELTRLADAYELVWATTWRGEANEWIGPHLGLPELPHIEWPSMWGRSPRGTFWKTQYVLEYAGGRPFAWIDDEITALDREFVERDYLGHALLMTIHPALGLTRADFDALAAWADELGRGGPGG
ncbi:HAD domain-containing protein, partial [Streptomyces sp. GC420]|uniref:HAD domain-containing protein n=1 Tax=Streptomyces sp. GC420 TaxID=2697568 RepID=UPI00141529EE